MVNIKIERHQHWQLQTPYDPLRAPSGDASEYLLLNPDIQQWLDHRASKAHVFTTKVAHTSKKFQVTAFFLAFEDPEEAMLFKLTWC